MFDQDDAHRFDDEVHFSHEDGCECTECEPLCIHCSLPLDRGERAACEKTPDALECDSCIGVISDRYAPPTREQLVDRLGSLRRVGYGMESRPVRELVWCLRDAS